MSIESTIDLQTRSSPRSLAVLNASATWNSESVVSSQRDNNITFLFGTEDGFLHARSLSRNNNNTLTIQSEQALPGPIAQCVVLTPTVFLLLVDDSKQALRTAHVATLRNNNNRFQMQKIMDMTCAADGGVYAAGRVVKQYNNDTVSPGTAAAFDGSSLLPVPGARSGADAMVLVSHGKVVVVAVANSFYAVATEAEDGSGAESSSSSCVKILSFSQSSQVHSVLAVDVQDTSVAADWSTLFLANGRDCAVVDLYYNIKFAVSKPRHGTVTLASPILAAASSWPWLAILTSDGLVSLRSPSCLAIPLRTVEVGNQPNDYFALRSLGNARMLAISYSGAGKVLVCHPDTAQDLADRLMRHAIDAFGAKGFPRAELAEAMHASFTATSYVGPEPSQKSKLLLQQYLEAVLGLTDWDSGGTSGWPTELPTNEGHHGSFGDDHGSISGRGIPPTVISSTTPAALLTGSALLCLVCMQLSPPFSSLASRAAKVCAEKIGVVIDTNVNKAAILVCETVAETLLRDASSSNFSLVSGSSPVPIARGTRSSQATVYTEFVEASIWLLRACGRHERAIDVAYEKLQRQTNAAGSGTRSTWSRIKYESSTATHLSDLWASKEGCELVIKTPATRRLLESNPGLGLSVFTSVHPQSEAQWRSLRAANYPLARPELVEAVVELLKSVHPAVPFTSEQGVISLDETTLPLESGRALAVSYLESALGVDTGRPLEDDEFDAVQSDSKAAIQIANFHDELSFLLLEGVIAERRDDETGDDDTGLGRIYRLKLRKFLRWPKAKIRSEKFMNALPPSFLQEKALLLGRLGRHEDALRILYRDLKSLELALDYCDDRHEQLRIKSSITFQDQDQYEMPNEEDNAYLPLVRVALDSEDKDRGTAAAIKVLALRRGAIDRAAALRLLPSDVPVSSVARPFLIPALVDSESQVRRLTVVSALLRAKYLRLKDQLTSAQLKVQSNLQVVPQLRSLNLGDPLHSTNPFRARTSAPGGSNMPDVMIVKHFFPRHLVIQAKVTNSVGPSGKNARTLSAVSFVVAESSEDAIQPLLQVPIQVLPYKLTGYAWCVLSASPARMDGPTAQLTCELRYTVQSVEASPWTTSDGMGRTYVEELQDLEVHAAHFS